jgi:hypothetical protein
LIPAIVGLVSSKILQGMMEIGKCINLKGVGGEGNYLISLELFSIFLVPPNTQF